MNAQELIKSNPAVKQSVAKLEAVKLQLDSAAEKCMLIKVTDEDSLFVCENNLSKINSLVKTVEDVRKQEKQPFLEAGKAIDEVAKYVTGLSAEAINHLKTEKKAYVDKIEAEAKRKKELQESVDKLSQWCELKTSQIQSIMDCDIILNKLKECPGEEKYQEFYPQVKNIVELYTGMVNLKKTTLIGVDLSEEDKAKTEELLRVASESVQQVVDAQKELNSTPMVKIGKTRKVWKFELVDITQVPVEWLLLDETKVKEWIKTQELKDGDKHHGIKFYQENIIIS
jgi:hypothetical protein